MSIQTLNELHEDLSELKSIAAIIKRDRIKNAINSEINKLESEIKELEVKVNKPSVSPTKPTKQYEIELSNYAWDQSDKFVKIFVTLNGADKLPEENVIITFTDNSIQLNVNNLNNKNYKLIINKLLERTVSDKSYTKPKTDVIIIFIKKEKEGLQWSHLTATEKRLDDAKKASKKADELAEDEDPSAGLMKIMQNMYESGDPDTKRMLSKAWYEAQQKNHQMDI